MIIDCISDLHGHLPDLPGGDLLLLAGDYTARDELYQWSEFFEWVIDLPYERKVMIAGNHDGFLEKTPVTSDWDYLCDSGTEQMGLKIYGSPWTKSFEGMNPKCKAFVVDTEEELEEKWALIPEDTNILITHSPPKFMRDRTADGTFAGSSSLLSRLTDVGFMLHVFGHIHEGAGKLIHLGREFVYVNASHVNERYEPVHEATRVIL